MDPSEIRRIVMEVVRRHARFLEPTSVAPPETPLSDLGIDSMATIDLLLDLEQTFSVVFPDEMLTEETFRDVRHLGLAVESLVATDRTD